MQQNKTKQKRRSCCHVALIDAAFVEKDVPMTRHRALIALDVKTLPMPLFVIMYSEGNYLLHHPKHFRTNFNFPRNDGNIARRN